MRVHLTGASGFVGSNLAHAFDARGWELDTPTHSALDLTDALAVARRIEAVAPEVVVHAAIRNDPAGLLADRAGAHLAYVGATRHVVDAANAVGAQVILISTDWVFDGTQGGATEATPPNPVNSYGFLKAASEQVVEDRAQLGAIARIAGVQGVHRARPRTPREQDAGFGYLVASLVDALGAGRPFTVWESPEINTVATPTLAAHAAELIARVAEQRRTGIFHCCGGEAIDRAGLARAAVDAFGLDGDLLRFGPPPPGASGGERIPYDTSLGASGTAAVLGVDLPDVRAMLDDLKTELEEVAAP